MNKNNLLTASLIFLINCAVSAQTTFKERVLSMSVEINASVDSVWSRWITESGRKKFFAPSSRMELSTLGFMEILFNPQAPEGQRGAENNRVMAVQPKEMLSFTWDAPPQFSEIRKQRTLVVVRLQKINEKKTKVILNQMGWGNGADWDKVYDYFSKAWSGFVLPNLKYSLETSPVDWNDFPNKLPKNLPPAIIANN